MTFSSTLARYLFYEPSQVTDTFLEQLLEEGIKPNDIIVFTVKFISKYALTDNLWLLLQCKEFLQALSELKTSKLRDKERVRYIKLCKGLFDLLLYYQKAQYKFYDEDDSYKMFENDIQSYLNVEQNTIWGDVLIDFKDILRDDVFSLLNILQKCLQNMFEQRHEIVLRKSFIIVRYLLTLTPKRLFKNTKHASKLDIIDIIFIVCMLFCQMNLYSNDIAVYVAVAKDIFYLRCPKKDKRERVNLLFYVIYTIITKKVTNIPYDGIGLHSVEQQILEEELVEEKGQPLSTSQTETSPKQSKDVDARSDDINRKCKWLYFYSDYDEHVGLQIKFERERLRLIDRFENASRLRNVDVAWNIENEKNFVCVSKLQDEYLRS